MLIRISTIRVSLKTFDALMERIESADIRHINLVGVNIKDALRAFSLDYTSPSVYTPQGHLAPSNNFENGQAILGSSVSVKSV